CARVGGDVDTATVEYFEFW
nr:immunoglobulin heavy chain junction region [Macaca mulatta]MOW45709.1 immunoglobulin heavy chain junction region [Macaca mulatta]MOW46565.1 immunoglobulin heavy chain junction region [Macaca mulatta]MOW47356.1 immunoglobulin heavy chain junction region [Macaca mulatta]MOW47500.1 immunoglobulin heavy chain junction region [Macaca mulatta]